MQQEVNLHKKLPNGQATQEPIIFNPVHTNIIALFCDIRNFTTISEVMSGDQLANMLQHYFDEVTSIIVENNGIVDKFIGDAVFAVFYDNGTQEPFRKAMAAARKITQLAKRFNTKQFGLDQPLGNGIGMAAGQALRLPLGSLKKGGKLEITHIGNVVNLASRLEGLSKNPDLDEPIVISDTTYHRLPNNLQDQFSFLGRQRIKGKRYQQDIYGVRYQVKEATILPPLYHHKSSLDSRDSTSSIDSLEYTVTPNPANSIPSGVHAPTGPSPTHPAPRRPQTQSRHYSRPNQTQK